MKLKLFIIILFLICAGNIIAQQETTIQNLKAFDKYDFSSLWTKTDNSVVFGFIGKDYQRIRIKLISVIKNPAHPLTYFVYGKSMVKDNICSFVGNIKINSIRKYNILSYGVDSEYYSKGIKGQYFLSATYSFREDKKQFHSGIFVGTLKSDFYIDKRNKIKYDDIEINADGYSNNEFVGKWTSYDKKIIQQCNWGDYRIPVTTHFDIGAGEFSPDDKYLKFGWQSYRDAYANNTDSSAWRIENAQWWK